MYIDRCRYSYTHVCGNTHTHTHTHAHAVQVHPYMCKIKLLKEIEQEGKGLHLHTNHLLISGTIHANVLYSCRLSISDKAVFNV